MGAFTTNSLDLIRRVFRRDQMVVGASPEVVDRMDFATRGMTAMMSQAYGPLSGGVDTYMHDTVSLNHDLVSRFEDYESMDEFPEVAAALDLFADDATVQDVMDGKSMWFEAPDTVVQDLLNNMLGKQLRAEEDLWSYARNICKYGNNYLEVIALDQQGVIDLKPMYVPATRRIQDQEGVLYGYVHDPALGFSITTAEFFDRIKMKDLENPMKLPDPQIEHVRVFEPWEVVHFRMQGSNVSDIYGISITDAARYAWKRLMMMEDAMVVFRLCLRGDSQIWTPSGRKAIKDLVEGEEVYSYGHDRQLKRTKVVHKKCNGTDKIYKVRSTHRAIYANATHPVLVETIECHGKGSPRTRRLDYVEVQNLIPGKHRFCTPSRPENDFEVIGLKCPDVEPKARLRGPFHGKFDVSMFGRKMADIGLTYPYAKDFFSGEGVVLASKANKIIELLGLDPEKMLDYSDEWTGLDKTNIPKVVDEDFARWFGFMLGDGYVSQFLHDGNLNSRVGFSLGMDRDCNELYKSLFEKMVGSVTFTVDKRSPHGLGQYLVSSKHFAEFMMMNGFIQGAHHKRVPEWVYKAAPSIRMAFLQGFIDADGHEEYERISLIRRRKRHTRARVELCNLALVEDLRELAMQLGLVVTKVNEHFREGGRTIKGTKVVLKDRMAYEFDVVMKRMPESEKIVAVEPVGEDEIWDIGVEANEHNFVADGVVVHNTRSPQRYAFYVDVGDVPPAQAKRLLQQVKNDFKKEKVVDKDGKVSFKYSPLAADEDFFLAVRKEKRATEVEVLSSPDAGQMIEDVNYFKEKLIASLKIPKSYLGGDDTVGRANLCLVPETKIPLLDGRALTLEEMIAEHAAGREMWVYSVSPDGRLEPDRVVGAGWTRKDAEVVRVHLDNGEFIDATPDHPFMTRDGSYTNAEHLQRGASLMPFYERLSEGKIVGYREIYDPCLDRYVFAHRMVSSFVNRSTTRSEVVHHKNFKRLDNSPQNLVIMDKQEHLAYHRDHAAKTLHTAEGIAKTTAGRRKWLDSDECKDLCRANMSKARAPGGGQHAWNTSAAHRELKSKQMAGQHQDGQFEYLKSAEFRERQSIRMKERIARGLVADMRGSKNHMWRDISFDGLGFIAQRMGFKSKRDLIRGGYSQALVDRIMQTHGRTFADFSAIYLGGYKLNRKGMKNHKVVRVERLMERRDTCDIQVERNHNFATQAGVIVHNSQLDVRMARSVMRVQRVMKNGYHQIARVDLAAKNIDPDMVQYEAMMNIPSGVLEMAQVEVQNAKLDLAGKYREAGFSQYYIWSRVLGMSEDEVQTIRQQLAVEQGATESQAESVQRIVTMDVDHGERAAKKLDKYANQIKEDIAKGQSEFGKRMRELKLLMHEVKHSVSKQRGMRWNPDDKRKQ